MGASPEEIQVRKEVPRSQAITDAPLVRPPVGGAVESTVPSQQERAEAILCHVSGFLAGFLVPLILFVVKKDRHSFVSQHAREALNFQITLMVGYMVAVMLIGAAAILTAVVEVTGLLVVGAVGILLFIALVIFEVATIILASLAAHRGEIYMYPLNIRFIR